MNPAITITRARKRLLAAAAVIGMSHTRKLVGGDVTLNDPTRVRPAHEVVGSAERLTTSWQAPAAHRDLNAASPEALSRLGIEVEDW